MNFRSMPAEYVLFGVDREVLQNSPNRRRSPAMEADLKLDDELVAISEISGVHVGPGGKFARCLLCRHDGRVKVRRKGNLVNVKLTLQRSFQYPPAWSSASAEAAGFLDALPEGFCEQCEVAIEARGSPVHITRE